MGHPGEEDVELGKRSLSSASESSLDFAPHIPSYSSKAKPVTADRVEDGNYDSWKLYEKRNNCSPDYKWNKSSVIRNRMRSGHGEDVLRGFNTSRKYDMSNYDHRPF